MQGSQPQENPPEGNPPAFLLTDSDIINLKRKHKSRLNSTERSVAHNRVVKRAAEEDFDTLIAMLKDLMLGENEHDVTPELLSNYSNYQGAWWTTSYGWTGRGIVLAEGIMSIISSTFGFIQDAPSGLSDEAKNDDDTQTTYSTNAPGFNYSLKTAVYTFAVFNTFVLAGYGISRLSKARKRRELDAPTDTLDALDNLLKIPSIKKGPCVTERTQALAKTLKHVAGDLYAMENALAFGFVTIPDTPPPGGENEGNMGGNYPNY